MKIYFTGAIRGGRELVENYRKIIKIIKEMGHQVLTEHVGDSSITEKGEDRDLKEIFNRDLAWLKVAEILIAEVSKPSLGVGYEVATSLYQQKPTLCLYLEGLEDAVSGMIMGNTSKFIKIVPYRLDNLEKIIKKFLDKYK